MTRAVLVTRDPDLTLARRERIEADGGVQVVGASAQVGRAAVMVVRTQADLLVTELRGLDGPALPLVKALQAGAARPAPQILLLTATAEDPLLFETLRAGAHSYCTAHDEERLDARLRDVLRGGSEMGRSIAARLLEMMRGTAGAPDDIADLANPLGLDTPERRLLHLLAEGATIGDVAVYLGASLPAVRQRMRAVYRKLHWLERAEGLTLQAA